MSASTTTFQTLKQGADNTDLVRKILEAVAFVADEDADEIEDLVDSATGLLLALPTTYTPIGLVNTDGFTFGGDTNTEDVNALGYSAPVRTDITSQTRTVAFTPLEADKRVILEQAYGLDLSGISINAVGQVKFDHPDRPVQRFRRLLVIGRDGSTGNEWFRGKFFPRASVLERPEEVWNATDPRQLALTYNCYVDSAIGTGERDFIAGTGALAAGAKLGFGTPPVGP